MQYLAIFIGGGIGSVSRYLLSRLITTIVPTGFPLGTMTVNLLGCFIIGFLTSFFERYVISPEVRLFIFVGFLGGFTTFSSFGVESFNLFKSGELRYALINVLASNIAGIAFVLFGYALSKIVFK